MLNTRTADLLQARGIDPESAGRFGLATHTGQHGDNWLKIPYLLNGVVVNHKYRTLSGEKCFYQDEGAQKCLWNADVITDPTLADQPLIITEGELDAVVAIQCGFARVVSVPDGAPSKEVEQDSRKFDFLIPSDAALKACREIILATDGDGPGCLLRDELALRIGRARCKFVTYPAGAKDLNDVLKAHGESAVVKIVAEARWLGMSGVYRLSELPPRPRPDAYSTGIPGMDEHYKVRFGDFVAIVAIPSHGKTTFVNDLSCRLAEQYGWTIGVASFEQPPQTEHVRTIMRWKLRKPPEEATKDERAAARAWIEKHFVFIANEGEPGTGKFTAADADTTLDLNWTLERMAVAVRRHNCKVIILDPWNELDHWRLKDESLTEYTGRAIKMFKRFASEMNVHLIVVAHPTKMIGRNGEKPAAPGLYDISDSAHWANKPEVGISIWRDFERGMTLAEVKKVRYQDSIGVPGKVWLRFNTYTGRFEEGIDPDDMPRQLGAR